MVVSLAEAKNNTTTDLDVQVIDEFRKYSAVLDALQFDDVVNPAGGGATLDYGYRRLVTQRDAAFRPLNTEYTPAEVTTQKVSTTLAPLGGAFQVDRVIAQLGPAASGAVSLQLQQVIKATVTKFQDAVINGDTAVDAAGFDGLDKALVGSTTELGTDKVTDWSDFDSDPRAEYKALDALDEFLSVLDGLPTIIFGNRYALARVRAAVRRAGMYTQSPVIGLTQNGQPVLRENYGGIIFADPGEKAASSNPIIPVRSATVGGSAATGLTDLYAVRVGMDGFKGLSTVGGQLVKTYLPDFTIPLAVKRGEVEMGPVSVALMATRAAAVLRNVKVR